MQRQPTLRSAVAVFRAMDSDPQRMIEILSGRILVAVICQPLVGSSGATTVLTLDIEETEQGGQP